MKCFVLSLHRSATKSVSALLEQLGLSVIHWPGVLNGVSLQPKIEGREMDLDYVLRLIAPKLSGYDAASDVPIPTLYPLLYRHYPTAKFILVRRDPRDWVRSVRKSIGDRKFRPFERVQYWTYLPARPSHISRVSDDALADLYLRHTECVTRFFGERDPDHLGVYDLLDPECGGRIADFLGYSERLPLPRVAEDCKQGPTKSPGGLRMSFGFGRSSDR